MPSRILFCCSQVSGGRWGAGVVLWGSVGDVLRDEPAEPVPGRWAAEATGADDELLPGTAWRLVGDVLREELADPEALREGAAAGAGMALTGRPLPKDRSCASSAARSSLDNIIVLDLEASLNTECPVTGSGWGPGRPADLSFAIALAAVTAFPLETLESYGTGASGGLAAIALPLGDAAAPPILARPMTPPACWLGGRGPTPEVTPLSEFRRLALAGPADVVIWGAACGIAGSHAFPGGSQELAEGAGPEVPAAGARGRDNE